jgi:putative Holliday junction resolvase
VTAILGVDLGERRIGLAIAEGDGAGARPLTTLPRRTIARDAAAIGDIIEREQAVELVVGLPLEAAGQEGAQAALTRAWVDELLPFLPAGVRLSLRDERLTSHLAETRLGLMPRGRSGGPPTRAQRTAYRARVDREAASIILQDELDARRAVPRSTTSPTGGDDMERT